MNFDANGNVGIDGDIFTKNWGYRSADGSTTNLYIGRFSRNRPVNIEINTSGSSVGSTSTFEVLRHYNAHPVVSGNVGEAFARYQWYYQSVDNSDYDLWVRPIHASSGNYDIRALSSGYQVVTEPGSPTLVSCVYGVITCGKYNENSLTGIGTTNPTQTLHIYKDANEQTTGLMIEKENAGTGAAAMFFAVSSTAASEPASLAKCGILFQRNATNGRGDLKFCLDNVDDTNAVTSSDAKMVITADGDVGIGTTNPSAPFHVTATGDTKTTGTPATNGIYVYNPTNSANQDACLAVRVAGSSAGDPFISFDITNEAGWCLGIDNSDANKFKICNNWRDVGQGERITIDASGNVGIGTASPQAPFHVHRNGGDNIDTGSHMRVTTDSTTYGSSGAMVGINCKRGATSDYRFLQCNSGYGTSGTIDAEFILYGSGLATADGSWNGGGADYAEMFEWYDGNPLNEDRVGMCVKLRDDKIELVAEHDDPTKIIGVISGAPAFIGDHGDLKWKDKYLKDDFGRYIEEDYELYTWNETRASSEFINDGTWLPNISGYEKSNVTISIEEYNALEDKSGYISIIDSYSKEFNHTQGEPLADNVTIPETKTTEVLKKRVLNPNYDPSTTYISRKLRKEWSPVGLVGKLRIKNDQLVHPNWIKMKYISESVDEWLVR